MFSTTIVYSPLAYVQLFHFLWFQVDIIFCGNQQNAKGTD